MKVPEVASRDRKTRKLVVKKNVLLTLRSTPVCCLADIPIMHLAYHANRYGKFAIGFHRDVAIQHHFNPAFYTLHNANVIRTIHGGFAKIEYRGLDLLRSIVDEVGSEIERPDVDSYLRRCLSTLRLEADSVESAIDSARDSIKHFLAFVKTFDLDEFQTIYSEREWRAVRRFRFQYSDVAMIVLPKKVGRQHYFEPFLATARHHITLPASIPVVPWEDLVES